jgi:uncharacterized protein (DUF1697 family)
MKQNLFAALIRGINVGGNNIIRMADLKVLFGELGFSDVSTYIQSGNVLFRSAEKDQAKLSTKIEKALEKHVAGKPCVVVVSHKEFSEIVTKAPKDFGKHPDKYRYDAIFLKDPLKGSEAIKQVFAKEGVDEVHAGKHALYFSRLISKVTQSRINKIVGTPVYKSMTIRNWNTTAKLLGLMEKMGK